MSSKTAMLSEMKSLHGYAHSMIEHSKNAATSSY